MHAVARSAVAGAMLMSGCGDSPKSQGDSSNVLVCRILASQYSPTDFVRCDAVITTVLNDDRISLSPKQQSEGIISQGIWFSASRIDTVDGSRCAYSSRVGAEYFSNYDRFLKEMKSVSLDQMMSEFQSCISSVEAAAGGFDTLRRAN